MQPCKVTVAQSCLTLCDPTGYSPPGSSVHGILQARILEWVAIPSSRGSSQARVEPRSPALQADSLLSKPLEDVPKLILLPSVTVPSWWIKCELLFGIFCFLAPIALWIPTLVCPEVRQQGLSVLKLSSGESQMAGHPLALSSAPWSATPHSSSRESLCLVSAVLFSPPIFDNAIL